MANATDTTRRILAATLAAILAALIALGVTACHSDPCWQHGGTKKYTQSGNVGVFWCNDGTNSVSNGLGS